MEVCQCHSHCSQGDELTTSYIGGSEVKKTRQKFQPSSKLTRKFSRWTHHLVARARFRTFSIGRLEPKFELELDKTTADKTNLNLLPVRLTEDRRRHRAIGLTSERVNDLVSWK